MTSLREDLGDSLESLEEEGSGALYYSPEDEMIYEVTTDSAPQQSSDTPIVMPSSQSTQDVINQEPGNMTIDQMLAAGMIEEITDSPTPT